MNWTTLSKTSDDKLKIEINKNAVKVPATCGNMYGNKHGNP